MKTIAIIAASVAIFTARLECAAAEPNDPYFGQGSRNWSQAYDDQWALRRINLDPDASPSGARIIVAVIDSGLDFFHPDLTRDQVWENRDETLNGKDDDGNGYIDDIYGWDFLEDDNNPWDRAGHGTHVAGVIAADTGNGVGIAGINPSALIMPLRVLNFLGEGRSHEITEAIRYAADNGARVINLSLGGHHISEAEQMAIDYAVARDVVVVVAAGNTGENVEDIGPAGGGNVITVGASGPDDKRAVFSNWGANIDLVAPGVDVLSLRARWTDFALVAKTANYKPGSNFVGPQAAYYRASGTSFAAPLVTGVASLLRAKDPSLSAADVKRILTHSAQDIDIPGVEQYTGFGLLDARAALAADRNFFINARFSGARVVQGAGGQMLQIMGNASADRFDEAWIEIGRGPEPDTWTRTGADISRPVIDGVLGEISASKFEGSPIWILRLITKHKNGDRREARFELKLQ